MSWDVCHKSKQNGGWGIGSLVSKNVALAAKQLQHFSMATDSLWYKIIKSKHGFHQKGWDELARNKVTHISL